MRYVRTPEGERRFGQPIGTPITEGVQRLLPDMPPTPEFGENPHASDPQAVEAREQARADYLRMDAMVTEYYQAMEDIYQVGEPGLEASRKSSQILQEFRTEYGIYLEDVSDWVGEGDDAYDDGIYSTADVIALRPWAYFGACRQIRAAAYGLVGYGDESGRSVGDPFVYHGSAAPDWGGAQARTSHPEAMAYALMTAVHEAEHTSMPLYRGIDIDYESTPEEFVEALREGDTFDMPLASFTDKKVIADKFGASVTMVLMTGARAFNGGGMGAPEEADDYDSPLYDPDRDEATEYREYISGGRFVVQSVHPRADGGTYIYLRQKMTFDPDNGLLTKDFFGRAPAWLDTAFDVPLKQWKQIPDHGSKAVRYVRTPEGERRFGKPIGSIIQSEFDIPAIGDVSYDESNPPPYLYRAVSEEDWASILENGYIQSDGRMNIADNEGTVAADRDPSFYLPNGVGEQGRIMRIAFDPEDGWWKDSDGYWKTPHQVPLDRVDMTTPPRVEQVPISDYTYGRLRRNLSNRLYNAVVDVPGFDGYGLVADFREREYALTRQARQEPDTSSSMATYIDGVEQALADARANIQNEWDQRDYDALEANVLPLLEQARHAMTLVPTPKQTRQKMLAGMDTKGARYVRTPEGEQRFGLPIGSRIGKDVSPLHNMRWGDAVTRLQQLQNFVVGERITTWDDNGNRHVWMKTDDNEWIRDDNFVVSTDEPLLDNTIQYGEVGSTVVTADERGAARDRAAARQDQMRAYRDGLPTMDEADALAEIQGLLEPMSYDDEDEQGQISLALPGVPDLSEAPPLMLGEEGNTANNLRGVFPDIYDEFTGDLLGYGYSDTREGFNDIHDWLETAHNTGYAKVIAIVPKDRDSITRGDQFYVYDDEDGYNDKLREDLKEAGPDFHAIIATNVPAISIVNPGDDLRQWVYVATDPVAGDTMQEGRVKKKFSKLTDVKVGAEIPFHPNGITLDSPDIDPELVQRIRDIYEITYDSGEVDFQTEVSLSRSRLELEGTTVVAHIYGYVTDGYTGGVIGKFERDIWVSYVETTDEDDDWDVSEPESEYGPWVHNALLTIDENFQGQGFAERFYEQTESRLTEEGYRAVWVQANIDVGGYAWARRGFLWFDEKGYDRGADSNGISRHIEDVREDLTKQLEVDELKADVDNALQNVSDEWDAYKKALASGNEAAAEEHLKRHKELAEIATALQDSHLQAKDTLDWERSRYPRRHSNYPGPVDRDLLDQMEDLIDGIAMGVTEPSDIASLGESDSKYHWMVKTYKGVDVPMWPGKWLLLGRQWFGIKPLHPTKDSKEFSVADYMVRVHQTITRAEDVFVPGDYFQNDTDSDYNIMGADLLMGPLVGIQEKRVLGYVRTPEGVRKYRKPIGYPIFSDDTPMADMRAWERSHDFVQTDDLNENGIVDQDDAITETAQHELLTSRMGSSNGVVYGDIPTSGYMVSLPPSEGTNKVVPLSAMKGEVGLSNLYGVLLAAREYIDGLADPSDVYLGTWVDDTQMVHLDVSLNIPDLDEAVKIGRKNNQLAIWDVANMDEIDTGGTGYATAKSVQTIDDLQRAVLHYLKWGQAPVALFDVTAMLRNERKATRRAMLGWETK